MACRRRLREAVILSRAGRQKGSAPATLQISLEMAAMLGNRSTREPQRISQRDNPPHQTTPNSKLATNPPSPLIHNYRTATAPKRLCRLPDPQVGAPWRSKFYRAHACNAGSLNGFGVIRSVVMVADNRHLVIESTSGFTWNCSQCQAAVRELAPTARIRLPTAPVASGVTAAMLLEAAGAPASKSFGLPPRSVEAERAQSGKPR